METANILLDSAKSVLFSITFTKSKKLEAKTYFLYYFNGTWVYSR